MWATPSWEAAWRPLSWFVGVGIGIYAAVNDFNPSGFAFAAACMGLPSIFGKRETDR